MLKKIFPLVLGGVFVAFPFVVHYGLHYVEPMVFASVLFVLLMIRTLLAPSDNKFGKVVMIAAAAFYCAAIAFFDSEQLLRYYPVLISLYVALMFFISLFDPISLIERFAKLSGKPYPDGARNYMRVLTKLWVLLLVVNALVAFYSACCSSGIFWLLYNGFISYFIILSFILAEWVFRQFYHRKHFSD
ncbi:MAG: putative membrane protein [Cellvibrionaceae bacterium]|jgi:uncharacterized membrane protein